MFWLICLVLIASATALFVDESVFRILQCKLIDAHTKFEDQFFFSECI